MHSFWWHSGLYLTLTHCITHNPVPLCQHRLGMKRNTKSNNLVRIYILQFGKLHNNYIHVNQNQ